jgi:hypothetical protein
MEEFRRQWRAKFSPAILALCDDLDRLEKLPKK